MNVITDITHRLSALYPEMEARAMARVVLEDGLGYTVNDVLMGKDRDFTSDDHALLEKIMSELLAGRPIQYVIGYARFYGRPFHVRPGCLIPRPETEDLVQLVVDDDRRSPLGSILDIGSGSGCIAVTLASETQATVTAWDIHSVPLMVTERNAANHNTIVYTQECDILNPPPLDCRRWDAIVSNPPYVRPSEKAAMSAVVLDHEPHEALFVPEDDPLLFHRAIGSFAATHLTPRGRLYLEVNEQLARETAALLSSLGLRMPTIHRDRYGKPRIVTALPPCERQKP